jgi:hypothetical protein
MIEGNSSSMTRLIAIQTVEGSNPFSRFFANVLHVGGLGSGRAAETKGVDGDFGRFRLAQRWLYLPPSLA